MSKVVRYWKGPDAGAAFIPGIPADDLTEDRYNALSEAERESVDESGLYQKSKPAGRREDAVSAPSDNKADANESTATGKEG